MGVIINTIMDYLKTHVEYKDGQWQALSREDYDNRKHLRKEPKEDENRGD